MKYIEKADDISRNITECNTSEKFKKKRWYNEEVNTCYVYGRIHDYGEKKIH
jgi:hypothetical protein